MNEIYDSIDKIIIRIDQFKNKETFQPEYDLRNNKEATTDLTNQKLFEIFVHLIAFSQSSKSNLVEKIIDSGIFKEIFANFEIDKVAKMNPCDLADKYWTKILGIRQQAKLFHLVTLARKMKSIGDFSALLADTGIPKKIKNSDDITLFWTGFKKLQKIMEMNKVPFFRSTTSLLHLLMHLGYDCIKPDLVVMKVAKKIGIVERETGNKNLIQTVRIVQEYSIIKKIRPPIVDLYFLIDEAQLGAMKFVDSSFYEPKYKC